ncbi:hypothetical protein BE11_02405 [Sorangium cellulosum]|nr:hypothetical protein BE11_02405 [Sorangium cellulosum]
MNTTYQALPTGIESEQHISHDHSTTADPAENEPAIGAARTARRCRYMQFPMRALAVRKAARS